MSIHATSRAGWIRPLVYGYGGALLLIGIATLAVGGASHWTAFIPLALGATVILAAVGAWRGDFSDRAAAVVATAVGLLALAGTLSALPLLPQAIAGAPEVANATAVVSRAATAAVTLAAAGFALTLAILGRARIVA